MTRARLLSLAGALVVVLASGLAVLSRPTPVPVSDALAYMTPAMNLVRHGVISREPYRPDGTPHPGLLEGGPLVVFEQAALIAADPALARSFACVLTSRPATGCPIAFLSLKLVHWAELLVFLLCLGATARLATGRTAIAWASVFAALLCKEMYAYAGLALTEPVYLACIGLAFYAWARALLDARSGAPSWIASGVAAGLAILAKPGSAALLPAALLLLALAVPLRRRTAGRATKMALVMAVCCAATLAPWLYRNYRVAGTLAFSEPTYLETSLAQRIGYDAMSWRDWGIAWIAYLPDFGDKLAASLFGRAPVERLGWGPTSYFHYGAGRLHEAVRREAGTQGATGLLVDRYMLGQPVKHAAVSAVLLWRGMFIGHYWGLVGFLALIGFFAAAGPWWEMAVLALPAYAIAALNAAVSVSITRYNLQLLVPEAVALGWVLVKGAGWIRVAAGRPTSRRPA